MSPSSMRTSVNPSRPPVKPVYRGPQALSHPVGSPVHHAPNAALLIDFDNVTMGIRSDLQSELKNLLSSEIVKGKVSVQRAYADWRRYPQYIVPLAEASIDLIFAPAYGSSKKNATDIRLAIDALELVFTRPEIGTFILLSGDSDFSSLVIKLKEYGKYVIGVGIRESSSDLLVQNCDEYYSYNALAGLVKSGEEDVVPKDPWELVTAAVAHMKKNGDVMRADRLKQVMQQMDSSFDEKNLGMSKFSRFVTEASQRKLLTLKKMENGQIEIDAPSAGIHAKADAGPTSQPARAGEPARERGGRGSRSRGGRGRGRGAPAGDDSTPAGTTSAPPEVAAASAPQEFTVGDQLGLAAASRAAPAENSTPARALARGRAPVRGRRGAPPTNLLSVGVVEMNEAPPSSHAAENGDAPASSDSDAPATGRPRRRGRTRGGSAKATSAKAASAEAKSDADAPAPRSAAAKKPRAPRRKPKKDAGSSPASSESEG
ncbi:MAG: NYN domain-containing protein [Gemmatimonadaceae bacterium]|nr:NYN domain-containing protein [Gemmatimonadaceae bacterium]